MQRGSGRQRPTPRRYPSSTDHLSAESPRINRAFYLLASFCRLELPHKAHEGKEKDPGELLQSDKFIALWKRQLFLLLKTPIKKLDKEGSFIDYNRLFFCSKVVSRRSSSNWKTYQSICITLPNTLSTDDHQPGGVQPLASGGHGRSAHQREFPADDCQHVQVGSTLTGGPATGGRLHVYLKKTRTARAT